VSPRVREDSVHPRLQSCAGARPLNFTVRGQMDASVVTAALDGAFPLLPLPSMSPGQAHLADQSLTRKITDQEWVAAGKPDAGRSWQEFTDDELLKYNAALAHFDEDSFVYYLPAYLRFAVRHCKVELTRSASELTGSAVFSVTHRTPYTLGRFKKLTPAQRGAVVCFLEFMAENTDPFTASEAQKALKRYWKTDEAGKPLIIVP
jgi:hypothetical protein